MGTLLSINQATALRPPPVSPYGATTLSIDKSSGCVGDTITISGNGYAWNSKVTIQAFKYEATTNSTGGFSEKLTIPGDGWLTAGTYTVVANDSMGNQGQATFQMLPSIALTPNGGPADSTVHVHGDCLPGGKVYELYVYFDDSKILTTDKFPMGVLDVDITIPKNATVGFHTITATTYDGDTASATFTVTSLLVTPEYPLGALAALIACGVAVFIYKKTHHN